MWSAVNEILFLLKGGGGFLLGLSRLTLAVFGGLHGCGFNRKIHDDGGFYSNCFWKKKETAQSRVGGGLEAVVGNIDRKDSFLEVFLSIL